MKKQPDYNSKMIVGLGALVTTIGRLIGGRVGSGITGFGLAHIFLGTLNKFRIR